MRWQSSRRSKDRSSDSAPKRVRVAVALATLVAGATACPAISGAFACHHDVDCGAGRACFVGVCRAVAGEGEGSEGEGAAEGEGGEGEGEGAPVLVVTAWYPSAPAWNDYVADDGDTPFTASGAPCEASAACVHGGALRRVEVPAAASCAGLTLVDDLGAFAWSCRLEQQPAQPAPAVVFAGVLKDDRGLGDLVHESGWLPNAVRAGDGATSDPAVPWWPNPVIPFSGDVLDAAGAVFVVDNARLTEGITVSADRVALVIRAGMVLDPSSLPIVDSDGDGVPDARALLSSPEGATRLWLEGSFVADARIRVVGGDHHRLHNVELRGEGITLANVRRSEVDGLRAAAGTGVGLVVNGGGDNVITRSRLADFALAGVRVLAPNTRISDVVVNDCAQAAGAAIDFDFGADGSVVTGLVASLNLVGVRVSQARGLAIVGVTSFRNQTGVSLSQGATANVDQALVIGGDVGVDVRDQATLVRASNIVVEQNTTGVSVAGGASWVACGVFAVVGNVTNGSPPTQVCTSDEQDVFQPPIADAVTLVGAVADAANASDDDAGGATFPAQPTTFDWFTFAAPFRVWVADDAGLFGGGATRWTQDGGHIADLRFSLADARVFNKSLDLTAPNAPFVAGGDCPRAAAVVVQGLAPVTFPYLGNAIEINDDHRGDDDGLCEAGEACVYAPNVGAYQGEGALVGPCVMPALSFAGSDVPAGIDMFAFAANGV